MAPHRVVRPGTGDRRRDTIDTELKEDAMRRTYETPRLSKVGSFRKSTGYLIARKAADVVTGWKDLS